MKHVICPNCGKGTAIDTILPRYRFDESGLPSVFLDGGVIETSCESCPEKFITIEKLGQLLQVIAIALLMKPGSLSGPEMKFLRGGCGLNQARLASALHHRRSTVAEREAKLDPRLTLAEEFLLRVVLLKAFRGFLDEGNDLLPASHRERLDDFTSAFLDVARGIQVEAGKHGPKVLVARMERDWQLDQAA